MRILSMLSQVPYLYLVVLPTSCLIRVLPIPLFHPHLWSYAIWAPNPLEQNICVATPVGNTVTCRKCVDNCLIVIEGKTLRAKLAVFSMMGFDVILGMDWLSKYGANIDCGKKEVIFRLHGIEELKFYGSCVLATPPLLSATQGIKSVREGAQAYLAYVQAKPEVKLKFKDIPVVH
jgi:hypothetical protein